MSRFEEKLQKLMVAVEEGRYPVDKAQDALAVSLFITNDKEELKAIGAAMDKIGRM